MAEKAIIMAKKKIRRLRQSTTIDKDCFEMNVPL